MAYDCLHCHNELHLSEELIQEAKSTLITFRCRECGCFFDLRIIPPLSQNGEETDRPSFQVFEEQSICHD
jgi:uncharacterized Zn finger protein